MYINVIHRNQSKVNLYNSFQTDVSWWSFVESTFISFQGDESLFYLLQNKQEDMLVDEVEPDKVLRYFHFISRANFINICIIFNY